VEHLKTYEGFFSKTTPDDEIALVFINRLKKVKKESPYRIQKTHESENNVGLVKKYRINFDDVSINVAMARFNNTPPSAFCDEHGLTWKQRNFPKKYPVFLHRVECTGEWEDLKCSYKYQRELFDLVDKLYYQDIEWRRINRINYEINPEADLLESNNFSLLDEVKLNIEDIFIDSGLSFNVDPYQDDKKDSSPMNFKIGLYPKYIIGSRIQPSISIYDIKDDVDRLFDYLGTIGEVKLGGLGFNPLDSSPEQRLSRSCNAIKWNWEKAKKYFSPEGVGPFDLRLNHNVLLSNIKLDDSVLFIRVSIDVWVYLD